MMWTEVWVSCQAIRRRFILLFLKKKKRIFSCSELFRTCLLLHVFFKEQAGATLCAVTDTFGRHDGSIVFVLTLS